MGADLPGFLAGYRELSKHVAPESTAYTLHNLAHQNREIVQIVIVEQRHVP